MNHKKANIRLLLEHIAIISLGVIISCTTTSTAIIGTTTSSCIVVGIVTGTGITTRVDATSVHAIHTLSNKRLDNLYHAVQSSHGWGRIRKRRILESSFHHPRRTATVNCDVEQEDDDTTTTTTTTNLDDPTTDIDTVTHTNRNSSSNNNNNNNNNNNKHNDHYYYYENGEDDDEWDQLEQIKKDLEPRLGGYRPYSIDTSYRRRPGQYSWTSKLVFLNIVIYGLQMIQPNITRMFAKRSDMIRSGRQLYRVITPIFLHGSISHLMINSFSLNNIGPEVEKLFGGGRFLATYLVGGIVGNLASAYYTPNPSLGASGAVFGLMGAYYTFLSRNEHLFGSMGQEMMGRVASTLGMNVLFGMMSPSIDNWAHIGGGIGGVAMATAFGPKLYYMMLPMGGGKILVDKPALRLPSVLESIPGKMSKRLRRIRTRMQVERYQSELPAKPWRRRRTKPWRRNKGRGGSGGANNKYRGSTFRWNQNLPPKRKGAKVNEYYRRPLYGGD